MIQKILLIIVAMIQVSYAQDKGTINMTDLLMDKPFYTVKIDAVNTKILITLNGEEVFSDYTKSQKLLEVPVNQFITSGENILKVYLMLSKDDISTLDNNAEAKVFLRLKKSEDFINEPITVSKIVYIKGKTNETTLAGNYSAIKKFILDKKGDVFISKLIKEKLPDTWTGEANKGIGLIQTITLETPFPRWKFLDSETIIEKNYKYISNDEYNTLRKGKEIEDAYKFHKNIYEALQSKNIDWVVNLFSERNSELETALYKPKGYYGEILKKRFTENMNDDTIELLPFIVNKRYFYISPGGKTLYIRNAITFNNKDGEGSTKYKILFRKENGKWILTR